MYEWLDKKESGENVYNTAISDNNVVFMQSELVNKETRAVKVQNTYYTVKGKEICTIDFDYGKAIGSSVAIGTPFRDSIAICNDNTGIVLVKGNGETECLVEWPTESDSNIFRERYEVTREGVLENSNGQYVLENVPCVVSGGISEGYFMVTDTINNRALVNINTGEMQKISRQYTSIRIEDMNAGYVCYSDNEGEMQHYGSLFCVVEGKGQEGYKYYLFDAEKHCDEEGNRIDYIACYDTIYFEDYKYLPVRDGEDYFYIDLEGNVVSDRYKKVTTFNDFEYALVQEHSGAVYVIDSEFRKLERVYNVDEFAVKDYGEVFRIGGDEESYSYYYGPTIYE